MSIRSCGAKALDRSDETAREVTLECRGVRAFIVVKACCLRVVTAISGAFGAAIAVAILGPDGAILGQGLARYTAQETVLIRRPIAATRSRRFLGLSGTRSAESTGDDMAL